MIDQQKTQKSKIFIGTTILVVGFLSPLLIPMVLDSDFSDANKKILSGLLAFGVPELFMLIAVAVMGKQGYEFIKSKLFKFLKPISPPDSVSLLRYRFGLVLFCTPIIIGIIQPYLNHYISIFREISVRVTIMIDVVFITSFFVLGGGFWDKLSGLFRYTDKE